MWWRSDHPDRTVKGNDTSRLDLLRSGTEPVIQIAVCQGFPLDAVAAVPGAMWHHSVQQSEVIPAYRNVDRDGREDDIAKLGEHKGGEAHGVLTATRVAVGGGSLRQGAD
jgi:hypothetical protein